MTGCGHYGQSLTIVSEGAILHAPRLYEYILGSRRCALQTPWFRNYNIPSKVSFSPTAANPFCLISTSDPGIRSGNWRHFLLLHRLAPYLPLHEAITLCMGDEIQVNIRVMLPLAS